MGGFSLPNLARMHNKVIVRHKMSAIKSSLETIDKEKRCTDTELPTSTRDRRR